MMSDTELNVVHRHGDNYELCPAYSPTDSNYPRRDAFHAVGTMLLIHYSKFSLVSDYAKNLY